MTLGTRGLLTAIGEVARMATILNCHGSQREDERHANPMLALPAVRHFACDVTMRLLQLGAHFQFYRPFPCSFSLFPS